MSASTSDVLTAIKNIVTALNAQTQQTLAIAGAVSAANISVPTVIKNSAGRIASVSVINFGTGGVIYDSAVTGVISKPIFMIPDNELGVFVVNMPCSFGIFVQPGTGTVTVSYS